MLAVRKFKTHQYSHVQLALEKFNFYLWNKYQIYHIVK